jgi:type I restriction enzyme S subunit
MSEWKEIILGDYIQLITDYHSNGSYEKLKENIILKSYSDYAIMIRTLNFERNDFENDVIYINEKEYNYLKKSKVLPGDILMNKIANAGSVYFMPNLGKPVSLAMNLFLIRLNDLIDQRFMFYLMKHKEGYIKLYANGAATSTITKEAVRNLRFIIPPLYIQSRITSILSAYDDLIENNLKRIKLLEELAQRTYEEWFVKFRVNGDQLEVNEVTGLPEGWEKKKLNEVILLIRKSVLPKNILPDTPYIGLEHIPKKSITLSEWETAEKVDSLKYSFKKGDILFGKIRPYFHKVGVALVDGIASSDTIILRAINKKLQGLILQTVFSDLFVNTATQSSNGTKMPRANWEVLKEYPVIIPTQEVLSAYDILSNSIIETIENLCLQNHFLKESQDILLPRLMCGKIEVNVTEEEIAIEA